MVAPKTVELKNISFINHNKQVTIIENVYLDNSIKGDTSFIVDNVTTDGTHGFSLTTGLNSVSTTLATNKYDFTVTNVDKLTMTVDPFGLVDGHLNNSTIVKIYPLSPVSLYSPESFRDIETNGVLFFKNCELSCTETNYLVANFKFDSCRFMPTNMILNRLPGNNTGKLTILSVISSIFEFSSINGSGDVNELLNNNTIINKHSRSIGYLQGSGNPNSIKKPLFVGQLYFDYTNKDFYVYTGLLLTDWKVLT